MPLPPDREEGYSSDELRKAMNDLKWSRELTIEWVVLQENRLFREVYSFNARSQPCNNRDCRSFEHTYYTFMPHGVYWACGECRTAMGPVPNEDGRRDDRREITYNEALEIMNRTGQVRPVGFGPHLRRRL